jgi:tRNA (mo5U34)-methyltransferase
MHIEQLTRDLESYAERLATARAAVSESVVWYQYDILSNLMHVERLLPPGYRDLNALAADLPVADIGAADGDLAFTLEVATGWELDMIDTAATNQNALRGAALLRERLGSSVQIHDIDLDQQFRLPRDQYGLVFMLGILYHLQNPFFVLRQLAEHSRYCIVSTRVARLAGVNRVPIGSLPVAYLVAPTELNNDATNYWIFAPAGVTRLAERTGWQVISTLNVGDVTHSVPDSNEGDERMFLLLQSNAFRR